MRPPPRLFDYPVRTVAGEFGSTVDGDTADIEVWLSRYISTWMRVRVIGVLPLNTPEVREEHGDTFTDLTRTWLATHAPNGLRVTTRAEDGFGRPLGDIYDAVTGEHLDTALLALAKELGVDIIWRR